MNDHTNRILERAKSFIMDFRHGKINLRNLVEILEGSINGIEERLPESFLAIWDDHWGNLEVHLALDNEQTERTAILDDLKCLEKAIVELLYVR